MDLVHPVDAIPVFWDIARCPVSEDDAFLVAPCIERFVRRKGYDGPISITAVGKLSKISDRILEAVSSTGITLYESPTGRRDIVLLIGLYFFKRRRPNTIVVISTPSYFIPHVTIRSDNKKDRNVVYPFPPDCTKAEVNFLWQNLLLADPVRCSRKVKPANWVCGVCDDLAGQGFENFVSHLSSTEHAEEILLLLPATAEEAALLNVYPPLEKNATTKVSNEAVLLNVDSPLEKNAPLEKDATTKVSNEAVLLKNTRKRGREEE